MKPAVSAPNAAATPTSFQSTPWGLRPPVFRPICASRTASVWMASWIASPRVGAMCDIRSNRSTIIRTASLLRALARNICDTEAPPVNAISAASRASSAISMKISAMISHLDP